MGFALTPLVRPVRRGYATSVTVGLAPIAGPLLPRQHGRQKPEFGLHLGGIGHSIGDFLAKEVAISLPEPMNGYLERSFRRIISRASAAYGASD